MATTPNLNAGPLSVERSGTCFLNLPAEIRIEIYRLAFVSATPVSCDDYYWGRKVKRTLKSLEKILPHVYDEAYMVFQVENTWEIMIENYGPRFAGRSFSNIFLGLDSHSSDDMTLGSIGEKRRFFIKLCYIDDRSTEEDVGYYDDIDVFRQNLRTIMWFLRSIPAIDYLRIQCFGASVDHGESYPLDPWGWPTDELGQILLTYVGEQLRRKKITGDTALDPLLAMYLRLEKYVGNWKKYEEQMEAARLATETGEHQRFLEIREDILVQVRARMAEMEEQVYLEDPGMAQKSEVTSTPDF
ncbi:hypothetical protein QBC43DRAFT_301000 [Cladorrhinum sp. PSN259]|nr:hypothetical protein QBC43DRAFT_301000 [Cladorrhinum sp. PSN259]